MKTKVYITKKGEWFDEGTEAIFLLECGSECALFSGIKDGIGDEEVCGYDEFEITETENSK